MQPSLDGEPRKEWSFGQSIASSSCLGRQVPETIDSCIQKVAHAVPCACLASCRLLVLIFTVGLGKTTLAHVAAQHCGYQPYEINASDDRTAASLVARIQVRWVLAYYMQHTGVYTTQHNMP